MRLTELLWRRKCGHHTQRKTDKLLHFIFFFLNKIFFFNDWSGCCVGLVPSFKTSLLRSQLSSQLNFSSREKKEKIYWKIPFRGPPSFFLLFIPLKYITIIIYTRRIYSLDKEGLVWIITPATKGLEKIWIL